MIRCSYCGAEGFISILGLQDHIEDGCPKWCGKCKTNKPTNTQLSSFIIGGGVDFDCPKTCPHAID